MKQEIAKIINFGKDVDELRSSQRFSIQDKSTQILDLILSKIETELSRTPWGHYDPIAVIKKIRNENN